MIGTSDGQLVCECDHLTAFAALFVSDKSCTYLYPHQAVIPIYVCICVYIKHVYLYSTVIPMYIYVCIYIIS